MAISNLDMKINLLESGDFDQFMKIRKFVYQIGEDPDDRDIFPDLSDEEYKALMQLKQQKYQKRSRIKKWFDFWKKEPDKVMLFLTFKFNDAALQKSSKARKESVWKQNNMFDDYICNIDFGPRTNREHYHSVVVADPEVLELMDWKYSWSKKYWYDNTSELFDNFNDGFVTTRLVDLQNDEALQKYEGKLTSHTLKVGSYKLGFKRKSKYQKYKADLAYIERLCRSKYKKSCNKCNNM